MGLYGRAIKSRVVAIDDHRLTAPITVPVRRVIETIVHEVVLECGSAMLARSFAVSSGHDRAV
jgi:hypothetical protein